MPVRQYAGVVAVALLCYAAVGVAQAPPPGPASPPAPPAAGGKGKADPQERFEPKAGPGEGQAFLAKFAGDWAVVKTFYPRAAGAEPAASRGACRQEMVHGGRFLRSEFTFDGPAGPTTGTGVIGFEPATGLFTSTWVDSRQTRMSFRRSRDKFDGKQVVLWGVAFEGATDGRQSRTVTTVGAKGDSIVHRQFSVAADGTERAVMQLEMSRKPAK